MDKESTTRTILGDNIKFYRTLAKITREELATKLNLSKSTIEKYELGDREPTITNLKELSEILKVPTDFLLEDSTKTSAQILKKTKTLLWNYREITSNIINILEQESTDTRMDFLKMIKISGIYNELNTSEVLKKLNNLQNILTKEK